MCWLILFVPLNTKLDIVSTSLLIVVIIIIIIIYVFYFYITFMSVFVMKLMVHLRIKTGNRPIKTTLFNLIWY